MVTEFKMDSHPKFKLSFPANMPQWETTTYNNSFLLQNFTQNDEKKYYYPEEWSGGLIFGQNKAAVIGFEAFETFLVLEVSKKLEAKGHRKVATALRIWKTSDSLTGAMSWLRANPCKGFNDHVNFAAPDRSTLSVPLICSPQ